MSDDPVIVHSPLERTVTKDGKTVTVQIYKSEDTNWFLEVVDQFNNSTVWDDQFDTAELALAEALSVIEDEGIDSLIGRDPSASLH